MKTVLYLLDNLGDGGVQAVVRDYATHLDAKQFVPIVAVVKENNLLKCYNFQYLNVRGIRVIQILVPSDFKKPWLLQKIWNRFIAPSVVTRRLLHILQTEYVSILHIHSPFLNRIIPIRKYIRNRQIPIFYTCHSEIKYLFEQKHRKELKSAKILLKENNLHFLVLHSKVKEEIDSLFGLNCSEVLHNGIDLDPFLNLNKTKRECRDSLGLPQSDFIIGNIGRFHFQKNQMFLLDIFHEVLQTNSSAKLVMVGSGNDEEAIRQKIADNNMKENCILLKHRTDVPEILRALDVFLLPSLFEGFPIVLIEAQVMGVRCVVSDVITQESIISNLSSSLSLNDSPKKWADTVLFGQSSEVTDCQIANFSIENIVNNLQNIYNKE